MAEVGKPLMPEATAALRRYHEAQDTGGPADKLECLRVLAESLFHAVSDYQLRVVAKARSKELPPLH